MNNTFDHSIYKHDKNVKCLQVLTKFPVIQHVLFGTILSFRIAQIPKDIKDQLHMPPPPSKSQNIRPSQFVLPSAPVSTPPRAPPVPPRSSGEDNLKKTENQ